MQGKEDSGTPLESQWKQEENSEPSAGPVGRPKEAPEPRAAVQPESGEDLATRTGEPQGLKESLAPTWKSRILSHHGRWAWTATGWLRELTGNRPHSVGSELQECWGPEGQPAGKQEVTLGPVQKAEPLSQLEELTELGQKGHVGLAEED